MNNIFISNNNNIITPKLLKEAFIKFSIDKKYLSYQAFNNVLEYLFRPPIPVLYQTFLSQKLFNLIDPFKYGQIEEHTFLQTFIDILRDRNYRILLSMKAMMTIPDSNRNNIQINEIKKFMFSSYVEGFKILGNLVIRNEEKLKQDNLPVINCNTLVNWAKKSEFKFYEDIDNDIKMLNNNLIDELDYNTFIKWINVDHCLYLQYGFIYLPVATSLVVLDKVKFDDFEMKKMVPQPKIENNKNFNDVNNKNNVNNKDNINNKGNKNKNNGGDILCDSFVILGRPDNMNNIKNNNIKKNESIFGFEVMNGDDFC